MMRAGSLKWCYREIDKTSIDSIRKRCKNTHSVDAMYCILCLKSTGLILWQEKVLMDRYY